MPRGRGISSSEQQPLRSKRKPRGKPWKKGESGNPNAKFSPGQSGNPGGRPKALKELKERIQQRGLDLVDMLFGIADGLPEQKGRVIVGPSHSDRYHVIKELLDRGYGRTVQAVEISGPGGGPLETRDMAEMTSSERRERLQALVAKSAGDAPASKEGQETDDET